MVAFTLFWVLMKQPTPKKGALIIIWLLGYQGDILACLGFRALRVVVNRHLGHLGYVGHLGYLGFLGHLGI